MEYAKSLILRKAGKNAESGGQTSSGDNDEEEDEESWTFVVGDEPDPEFVTKKLSEGFAGLAGLGDSRTTSGSQALQESVQE